MAISKSSVISGPTVTFNQAAGWVQVSATVKVPTYLGRFLGINEFAMAGFAEVAKKTVWTDIVISADVSGSMSTAIGGVPKINSARQAATVMVNSMFGADAVKPLLKMGLITWSGNARILPIGTAYSAATQTTQAVTAYPNPYWNGAAWPSYTSCGSCTNPYTGMPTTITTHYFYHGVPIPLMKPAPAGWRGCVLERLIDNNAPDDGDTILGAGTAGTKTWQGYIPLSTGFQCTNQGIRRLTNTKATIQAAVDQLTSPTGNTNMAMGLGMAWRLLGQTGSPFQGDGTPTPPPGEELVRALVVMTDGENTSTTSDAYNGKLTAAEMDARALAVATAIKATGVIIYAIQFEFNTGPLVAQMKQIASGTGAPYYQYAPTGAALQTAFAEIAAHLTKLRLTR